MLTNLKWLVLSMTHKIQSAIQLTSGMCFIEKKDVLIKDDDELIRFACAYFCVSCTWSLIKLFHIVFYETLCRADRLGSDLVGYLSTYFPIQNPKSWSHFPPFSLCHCFVWTYPICVLTHPKIRSCQWSREPFRTSRESWVSKKVSMFYYTLH